jgi:dipeptidyl aminopeptidase/acylaminoacyl peptidase
MSSKELACAKLFVVNMLFIVATALVSDCRRLPSEVKREITVADVIGMTRLAVADEAGGPKRPGPVYFSPDSTRFVVVVEKPNLDKNINKFSLLSFRTREALSSPTPVTLLTMSSSSNRAAIRELKWRNDNETITFLGENLGEISQVYEFNVRTRRLTKLTAHITSVNKYDITRDGTRIIFLAQATKRAADREMIQREGIVITSQFLPVLLAGDTTDPWENELFIQDRGLVAVPIPFQDAVYEESYLSMSLDGRYAVVEGFVREAPAVWSTYRDPTLHARIIARAQKHQALLLRRYFVVKTDGASATPLLDTPVTEKTTINLDLDEGQAFIGSAYLPLDTTDAIERREREDGTYDIAIALATRAYRKLDRKEWPRQDSSVVSGIDVILDQDLNHPPKLIAEDPKSGRKADLLDLNPQFKDLSFGTARVIELNVGGITVVCGLYLPPDYAPGRRYPLVIQTHGFMPTEFSMDGRSEWSSGFAARPLAAKGIIVLQASNFKSQLDHDRVGANRQLGATSAQAFKKFNQHIYETAIDQLDTEGLIDRTKVGISGFSRTVSFVAYALTHSSYQFATATLVDGIDGGYFQHISVPSLSDDGNRLNGGVAPIGDGLIQWIKESPSFNMDKVNCPVRLVALTSKSVLGLWEWFAGLTLQGKAVEFIEIPEASHQIVRPWERRIAQQGMVDWFRFWLQGEEGIASEKQEQYRRWREMKRDVQGAPQ